MEKFCPKCGKTKGSFVKSFCIDCYLEDHDLIKVPDKIQIDFCSRCNKIKLKHEWKEQDEQDIIDFVSSKIKIKDIDSPKIDVELNPIEGGKTEVNITVRGILDGVQVEIRKQSLLIPNNKICHNCMLLSSDYFEATIQLRYDEKEVNPKQYLEKIQEIINHEFRKDSLAKILETKKVQGGIDLIVGSKRAAKKAAETVAKEIGTKLIFSDTLAGVSKTGEIKKKQTFCIRF